MGVLTPSGGAGIWLADVASQSGLEVPALDKDTQAAFDELLPAYGASRNPVDVTAQFIFKHGFARALELMASSPAVDALLVASSMIHAETFEKDAANLERVAPTLPKPVMFAAYTTTHPSAVRILSRAGFPVFTSATTATRVMRDLVDHAARGSGPEATGDESSMPPRRATPAPGIGLLSEFTTRRWLREAGVETGPAVLATDAQEAMDHWKAVGTDVAMKLQCASLPHKSDVGGVRLGLGSARQVRDAFDELMVIGSALAGSPAIEGVQLTPLAEEGIDLILGIHIDELFGPMLLIGSGGVLVELLDDTVLVPLPASRGDIAQALAGLRVWPLLGGYRGTAQGDCAAFIDLALAIGRFARSNAEQIVEMDLNPVRVHAAGAGVTVLDALARTRSSGL